MTSAEEPTDLQPHVARMLDEACRLENDVQKLRVFIKENPIFSTLVGPEQRDMKEQLYHMENHLFFLKRRIKRACGFQE